MKIKNYIPIIEEALDNIGIDAEDSRGEGFGENEVYIWAFVHSDAVSCVIIAENMIYVNSTIFSPKTIASKGTNFYRDLLKINYNLPGSTICINDEKEIELKEERSLRGLDINETQELIESVCSEVAKITEKMKFKYDLPEED